jgi:hypothetical protein
VISIRVDDFPFSKPEEAWKHNLESFKRFDDTVAKYVDGYVLGVIPKHATEEQLDWLAANDRAVVAMHGVEHDERFPNEFREHMTERDVREVLLGAKQKLLRCNSDGKVGMYVPPHNVLDARTLRALKDAGFTSVFGGPGTAATLDQYAWTLGLGFFASEHPLWYGRSDELLERDHAHETILSYGNDPKNRWKMKYLTLHWTWETNIGLESLDRFLQKIAPVLR